MRLGATQRDVLFILFVLETKGKRSPFPAVELLALINKSRNTPIHGNNLRDGCHKMLESGLISKYRNPHSLQLAFTLSDQGRDTARLIYADRVKDDLNG